jgi:hypothetical protein
MKSKRRDFLKLSALGSFFAFPLIMAQKAFAELKLIDPKTNGTAKALGYVHEADKVDVKKWPKRAGAGKTQYCDNCQFYTAEKNQGKNAEEGKCMLLPGGLVAKKGWCNSWVKKV